MHTAHVWEEVEGNVWNILVGESCLPVWLAIKAVSVSSVLSVWLKRAIGLAPWNSKMLGTATVPKRVDKLHTQKNVYREDKHDKSTKLEVH